MSRPLDGRVAVVTGASRGLGYAVSLAIAEAGAHVIAVARTVGGLEELDDDIRQRGGAATLVPADLQDFDAIDRLGAAIYDRWGHLDVLIGNAGILGDLSPLGHIKPKVWDEIIAVNLTANWRLIRSMDPLLRQSDNGRATFISAAVARKTRPYWGAYAASKAGLEAIVLSYAAELRKTNVRVNLVDPGPMRTGLRAGAMPGEDPQKIPSPSEIAPHLVTMSSPEFEQTGTLFDWSTGSYLTAD